MEDIGLFYGGKEEDGEGSEVVQLGGDDMLHCMEWDTCAKLGQLPVKVERLCV